MKKWIAIYTRTIKYRWCPNDFKSRNVNLSPFMETYDIGVPKDNMLRQISELVDFSFNLEELKVSIY